MAVQTVAEMVEALPKPETLEEQYMYALACDLAGATPKYGVSNNAFTRKEKYWLALWKALSSMGGGDSTATTIEEDIDDVVDADG